MYPHHSPSSRPPSSLSEPATGLTELVTDTGVIVRLNDGPPSSPWPDEEPPPESEPPPSLEPVIIRPPADAHREHDARMAQLFEEHGKFIRDTLLLLRGNVTEESTKDLANRVLLLLFERAALDQLHENVRGFLFKTIENKLKNHRRRWKPNVDRDADVDAALSPETSPDEEASFHEEMRQIDIWLRALPEKHAEAIRCVGLDEMSLEEAGKALGRPPGTVSAHVARGRRKLREFALAAEAAEPPPPSSDVPSR